jgi:peptide deformylase
MVMKLVSGDDAILREPCQEFDFNDPPFDPIEYAKEMVKFMYDNNGYGIAANQIGAPYRFFAMRGHPENFVCFNPKIIDTSNETIVLEEGCLTFPNLVIKVKRPRNIRVRFTTPAGDVRTEKFTGMTARVFQHELDHLNGVLYFNRASRYHRDIAMRKWRNAA